MNAVDKKSLNSFLEDLKVKLYCYNDNPRIQISNMLHTTNLDNALISNNNGSDVYFYINGVRKLKDVNNFNACYIDIDAGRQTDGKYFQPSIVKRKKLRMMSRIKECKLQPTYIVETRNGYQLYWVFKQVQKNKILWRGVQNKLVNFFKDVGADPLAIKANQIFRLPYSYWRKTWEKQSPFLCKIILKSKKKYLLTEMAKALENISAAKVKKPYHASVNFLGKNYKEAIQTDKTALLNNKYDTISTVIDFLRQIEKTLKFSNNYFLSNCSIQLAEKLANEFCIG